MKVKKVRTSITINPDVLNRARAVVEVPGGPHRSVAQLVEVAVEQYVSQLEAADDNVSTSSLV